MKRYERSVVTAFGVKPVRGGTLAYSLNGKFEYGIYDISYEYMNNGLIVYQVDKNEERERETEIILTAALVVYLGISILVPAGPLVVTSAYLVVA